MIMRESWPNKGLQPTPYSDRCAPASRRGQRFALDAAKEAIEDVPSRNPFLGQWRIIDSSMWDREALDLEGPAHPTFEWGGRGHLHVVAVEGEIDYRVAEREGGPAVECSWEGADEGDPVSGRGWGIVGGDELRGQLFMHRGDDTSFRASRATRTARKRVGRS